MSDEEDSNKTILGIRKQIRGEKLTEGEQLAVENHARFMIALRRFIQHVVNYWRRWLIIAITSAIGGWSLSDFFGYSVVI